MQSKNQLDQAEAKCIVNCPMMKTKSETNHDLISKHSNFFLRTIAVYSENIGRTIICVDVEEPIYISFAYQFLKKKNRYG